MRYLILSDIHANLEALESTLAAAGECDAVLVLGDLVGYGADPNAVIERVQSLPNATIIRGNHDKVGAGVETVESFNHLARHAISWTATELTPENRQWLAAMPAGPALDRRSRRDLPRLAVRRGRLHLRRPRRAPRRRLIAATGLPLRSHARAGDLQVRRRAHLARAAARRRASSDAGAEGEVSDQLRSGRSAARRRSSRRVRAVRYRIADGDRAARGLRRRQRRRPRSSRRACQKCWRNVWRSADRTPSFSPNSRHSRSIPNVDRCWELTLAAVGRWDLSVGN